eukprot:6183384-Pleurochrysis_carterae.AAC.2
MPASPAPSASSVDPLATGRKLAQASADSAELGWKATRSRTLVAVMESACHRWVEEGWPFQSLTAH